jgi:hypothetical protein
MGSGTDLVVRTGRVAGSEVAAVPGVGGMVTICVTGDCAVCWLIQPEQKIRVMKAVIMTMAGIIFMISLPLKVLLSSIRFFDTGYGCILLSLPVVQRV